MRLDVVAHDGSSHDIEGEAHAAERFDAKLLASGRLPSGRTVEGAGLSLGPAPSIIGLRPSLAIRIRSRPG